MYIIKYSYYARPYKMASRLIKSYFMFTFESMCIYLLRAFTDTTVLLVQ